MNLEKPCNGKVATALFHLEQRIWIGSSLIFETKKSTIAWDLFAGGLNELAMIHLVRALKRPNRLLPIPPRRERRGYAKTKYAGNWAELNSSKSAVIIGQ